MGQTALSRAFEHPAFAPYRELVAELGLARALHTGSAALPPLAALDAAARARDCRNARGIALAFVAPEGRLAARDYERRILETGHIPTRADSWHDLLNALVWLRFPRLKAALNQAHVAAMNDETGPERSRRRDALTVFDESGVVIESAHPDLPHLLAARAWHSLFVARRSEVCAQMRFTVVGHAVLEKLLAPWPGITGKCLCVPTVNGIGAHAIESAAIPQLATLYSPRALLPLPVSGIPGWDTANADPAYYANAEVFRPASA